MKYFTIAIFLYSGFISAFTLNYSNEAHFKTNEVVIDVSGNDCTTAGYNSASELLDAAFEAANEFWNRVPTCALSLVKGSVRSDVDVSTDSLSVAIGKANPNTILIGCSNNASTFTAGILGVANINSSNQNQAAVLINNVDTSFANLDAREKLAVLAHEMGHGLGIGHSGDNAALMFASVGGKVQERLSMDDYNACSYLHPHDSPGSCSSIAIVPSDNDKGNNKWILSFLFGLLLMISFFSIKRDRDI